MRTTIDGVQGQRVTRIGGRSALQFYRDVFGTHSTPLNEMPMAVFEEGEQFYIRTPIDYDESDGSVGFSGTMSKNARVRSRKPRWGIISDVDASLGNSWTVLIELGPRLQIVSCASRKWILIPVGRGIYALGTRLPRPLPFMAFILSARLVPWHRPSCRAAQLHDDHVAFGKPTHRGWTTERSKPTTPAAHKYHVQQHISSWSENYTGPSKARRDSNIRRR
jgi:hypothetical protein